MSTTYNCLILGAAGRDFHNFQTFFKTRPEFRVRAFTATQIPFIESRTFPRSLAGPLYDGDIPIFPESQLKELIRQLKIDFVFLAYSDLSHEEVMHKASLVQACGASFALLGPRHTQLVAHKPVIAVTAVRTGAGKSPLSQFLATELTGRGKRVGILRHPMPYGDLESQVVERLATFEDLQRFECTVEEREEYEPYLEAGLVVFAGVDYAQILARAEAEADVLLWDGGNNDFSFLKPTVNICVVDALRPGHETTYYPGETNLRMADIVVINKVRQAKANDYAAICFRIANLRPEAAVIASDLEVAVDDASLITGKRVLVVEDGPTLTHGGMSYGAGTIAARRYGARELVDPRPAAVGTIADVYRQFPHLENVLPALGYSDEQRRELAETIERSGAEVVVDASPCRLDRLLNLSLPMVRVRYRFVQISGEPLVEGVLSRLTARGHGLNSA